MTLRTVPIRQVGSRFNLILGGDRELVLFLAVIAGGLSFSAMQLKVFIFSGILWIAGIYLLRKIAKADPQMRFVYLRHIKYKSYYPAQSTPFCTKDREYK